LEKLLRQLRARGAALPPRCFASPTPGPPCFSAAGAGHTSGAAQALPGAVETVYAREFEPL
jgi:hypothetical protein